MAANGGLSYVDFSSQRNFIMFTCEVEIAQGTKTDVTYASIGRHVWFHFLSCLWTEDLPPYIFNNYIMYELIANEARCAKLAMSSYSSEWYNCFII